MAISFADGLTPKALNTAMRELKGTWRDPVSKDGWKDATKCMSGSLTEKMKCWGGQGYEPEDE
jgi:hypothetical protein